MTPLGMSLDLAQPFAKSEVAGRVTQKIECALDQCRLKAGVDTQRGSSMLPSGAPSTLGYTEPVVKDRSHHLARRLNDPVTPNLSIDVPENQERSQMTLDKNDLFIP